MSIKNKLSKQLIQMDIEDIILKGGSEPKETIQKEVSEVRFPLRIPKDLSDRIDDERKKIGGFLSKNTWIIQAILEKIEKEKNDHRLHF